MKIRNKNILSGVAVALIIGLSAFLSYVNVASCAVAPVLMYHSVERGKNTSTPTVSPEIFARQMAFLSANRYNVVSPGKIISYITGAEEMPPRTVAITADDGLYNFYEYAYPVLKKHGLPSAIFVITDKIGQPGYLGWKELREMSESGLVTIGSHTKSHTWLPEASVDEKKLHEELVVSKNILEKGLAKPVDYLCYPNGGFNDLVKDFAKKSGYRAAFTTNPVRNSAMGDIYAIRRIKMSSSSYNPLILRGKISRYYAWFKERR